MAVAVAQNNVTLTVKGGNAMTAHLNRIAAKIGKGAVVRVGFLEGRRYPNTEGGADRLLKGLNNLNAGPGAKVRTSMGPHQPKAGLLVALVAYWNNFGTKRSKARPFFSNTIAELAPTLGQRIGTLAKASEFDSKKTLDLVGTAVKDRIVRSIKQWPADNAPLTVAIKGFNKGLIDQGIMQRSVDFETKKT